MKKIAVITLNGYFNYGNRLQNYALHEALKSLGFDVTTIKNNAKDIQMKAKEKRGILNKLKDKSLKMIYNICKNILSTHLNNKIIKKRINTFKCFTMDQIEEIDLMIFDNDIIVSVSSQYDYFVTGSDQVWNPDYLDDSSINFLTFAEKHKRIVYAPSFGVSEIKPEYIEDYRQWISGMHRLSVREDDGAKIIKDLTGRDAPVLVDPTLK